ncbi:ubiquitin-associated protein 1-like [Ornithorhynchus anatinus]|uniref:ubiquitin-associated protein 1-like n=1 Tax=Ornithorhynchus anatinus TaxID=9258 RepID=UPI0010A8879C|nr:ubiquitin-associated protein 1-like [Ornithorhynchus anatinus]
MSYLADVPFKVTENLVLESELVTASALTLPDGTGLLSGTLPDFSLEKRTLFWLEAAAGREAPAQGVSPRAPTDRGPSAPPCWLLLLDSGPGLRTAEAQAEGGAPQRGSPPQRRPRTAPAPTRAGPQGCAPEADGGPGPEGDGPAQLRPPGPGGSPGLQAHVQGTPRLRPGPATDRGPWARLTPGGVRSELGAAGRRLATLLQPPARAAASPGRWLVGSLPLPRLSRGHRSLVYAPSPASSGGATVPGLPAGPPARPPTCPPSARPPGPSPGRPSTAGTIPPIRSHKPTVASLSPYACLPAPPAAREPPGAQAARPDPTSDLLSALSQEERDLIEPVLALGYPLPRAVLALQRTGRQSLGQFLSYLGACDRLLKEGYEEEPVEEAMEMFQNSERKAAEFLRLVGQFHDMGFRRDTIKEVLLLHENHREKTLEELVARGH